MDDIVQNLILDSKGFDAPLQKSTELTDKAAESYKKLEKTVTKTQDDMSKAVKKTAVAVEDSSRRQETAIGALRNQLLGAAANHRVYGTSLNEVVDTMQLYKDILSETVEGVKSSTAVTEGQKKAVESLTQKVGFGEKAWLGFAKGLNIAKVALFTLGIGAAILGLTGLILYLTQTEAGITKSKVALAGFKAEMKVIKEEAIGLGKSLIETFANDGFGAGAAKIGVTITEQVTNRLKGSYNATLALGETFRDLFTDGTEGFAKLGSAINQMLFGLSGEQVTDLTNKLREASTEAQKFEANRLQGIKNTVLYDNALESIEGRTKDLEVEQAKSRAGLLKYKEITSDVTKSFGERIGAEQKAYGISQDIAAKKLVLAKEELQFIQFKNGATGAEKNLKAEYAAQVKVASIEAEIQQNRQESASIINKLEQERIKFYEAQKQKLRDIKKDLFDAADENGLYTIEEKKAEIYRRQVDLLEEQKKSLEGLSKFLGVDVSKEIDTISKLITIAGIEAKKVEPVKILDSGTIDRVTELKKKLEDLKTVSIKTNVDTSQAQGQIEKDIDKILKNPYKKEPPKVVIPLDLSVDSKVSALSFEETIADLQTDILNFFESDGFKKGLEVFGAIQEGLNVFTDLYTEGIDRQIEANEKILDDLDKRKEALEEQYDFEKDLDEEQRANNLKDKKEALDKLLEEEAKYQAANEKLKAEAEEKQRKAENLNQTASLITSSINIIKGFSNIPVVGLGLGIAAAASLIGYFAKIKIDAARATKLYKGTGLGKIRDFFGQVEPNGDTDKGNAQGYKIIRARDNFDTNTVISGKETLLTEDISKKYANIIRGMYLGMDFVPAGKYRMDTKQGGTTVINNVIEKKEERKQKNMQAVPFEDRGRKGFILVDIDGRNPGDVIYFN